MRPARVANGCPDHASRARPTGQVVAWQVHDNLPCLSNTTSRTGGDHRIRQNRPIHRSINPWNARTEEANPRPRSLTVQWVARRSAQPVVFGEAHGSFGANNGKVPRRRAQRRVPNDPLPRRTSAAAQPSQRRVAALPNPAVRRMSSMNSVVSSWTSLISASLVFTSARKRCMPADSATATILSVTVSPGAR